MFVSLFVYGVIVGFDFGVALSLGGNKDERGCRQMFFGLVCYCAGVDLGVCGVICALSGCWVRIEGKYETRKKRGLNK